MTCEGVAWFWMSEGSGNVYIIRLKGKNKTYALVPETTVSNTDLKMIKVLTKFLNTNEIRHNIHLQKSGEYKLKINCLSVKKFILLVYPWLVGRKKNVANLILKYFEEVYRASGKTRAWAKEDRERFLKGIEIYRKITRLNGNEPRKDLEQVIQLALKIQFPYKRVTKTCICGKTFIVERYRADRARFCSRQCMGIQFAEERRRNGSGKFTKLEKLALLESKINP